MAKAFATLNSERKVALITKLDEWSILTDAQLKDVLEQASVLAFEQQSLTNLVTRVGAFKLKASTPQEFADDIPF